LDVDGDVFLGTKNVIGIETGVKIGTYTYKDCDFIAQSVHAIYSTNNQRLFLGAPTTWAYCTYSSNIYYTNLFQYSVTTNITPCNNVAVTNDLQRIGTYWADVHLGTIVPAVKSDSLTLGQERAPMESDEKQSQYVFLAKELQEVFLQLVSTYDCEESGESKLMINYTGMIPIMTAVVNEQQTVIKTQQEANVEQQREIGILQQIAFGQELDLTELQELRNTVNVLQEQLRELQERVLICCKTAVGMRVEEDSISSLQKNNNYNSGNNNSQSSIQGEAALYQNAPNPFSSNTEISCNVPVINNSAFIYVYNLQGVELTSFTIIQTGFSTFIVYASALPADLS
jgi:hypothetical protein